MPVDLAELDKVNSSADSKIRIEGSNGTESSAFLTQTQSESKPTVGGFRERIRDPRMLALSEMTTPDIISMQEEDDFDDQDAENASEESAKKKRKPYASYIVRLK